MYNIMMDAASSEQRFAMQANIYICRISTKIEYTYSKLVGSCTCTLIDQLIDVSIFI